MVTKFGPLRRSQSTGTRDMIQPYLERPRFLAFLKVLLLPLVCWLTLAGTPSLYGQDNYEIQVYGSETVASNATMVELHSNFAIVGRQTVENGVLPTDHAEHETLEITHGFNSWFET